MRLSQLVVTTMTACLLAIPALAQELPPTGEQEPGQPRERQPGGQGRRAPGAPGSLPRLSPEKAQAAWQAQATHVGKSIGLNEEQLKTVLAAYAEVRQKHSDATAKATEEIMAKAREEAGGERGGERGTFMQDLQKKIGEIDTAHRDELRTALAASLNQEQLDKAMPALGSFIHQWDFMTDSVLGFQLDEAKHSQAMVAMEKFVVATAKSRQEGQRAAGGDSRRELTESMRSILTEEQFAQFQRSSAGRMRGEGRSGRGGEGGAAGGTGTGPGGDGAPGARGRGGRGRDGGAGGAEGGGAGGAGGSTDQGPGGAGGRGGSRN